MKPPPPTVSGGAASWRSAAQNRHHHRASAHRSATRVEQTVTWPLRSSTDSRAEPFCVQTPPYWHLEWSGTRRRGLHFHKYPKAKLTVEGRIRSRRQLLGLSIVPKATGGVTPHGGAAIGPKGPAIPNDIVGHAKGAEKPVTPRGSSAHATHAPDKEIVKLKAVTLTVGTQTLISTTDAGALQRWRAVQSSHQLELQTLQHKIGRILQDVASGHSTTRGSAAPPLPHRSDSSGYERRQSKLQQRGSGRCPADRRDPRPPRPSAGCPLLCFTCCEISARHWT